MPNFPLPTNHHAETLAGHSPAVVLGRACAVTGEPLRPGDQVVICDAAPGRDPMTVAGWATLGSCPHCGAGTGLVAAYVPPTWGGATGWGAPPAPPTPPAAAERERSPALVGGLVGLFLLAALAIAVAAFLFVLRTRDAEPTALPIAALTATAEAAAATAEAAAATTAAGATTAPATVTTTATPLAIVVAPSATPPGTAAAPTPTLFPTPSPIPSPTPSAPATALILIDPGDGGAIRALRADDTIDLNDLGRDTFNVLADVDSPAVESVIFLLDGQPFCPRGNCVENVAPYFMGGDSGGNPYDDWDWSQMLGAHTLTAIACTGDGGTGDCFAPIEVRLFIVR